MRILTEQLAIYAAFKFVKFIAKLIDLCCRSTQSVSIDHIVGVCVHICMSVYVIARVCICGYVYMYV